MSEYTGFEIAVTGLAGRFPAAANISEFWENLKRGVEAVSFFSADELVEKGFSSAAAENPDLVKTYGALLEGVQFFDANFFDYFPTEAEILEPQMRLFHECVYHGLEDAGYSPVSFAGTIGLYAGSGANFNWEAMSKLSGKTERFGSFASSHLLDRDFLCTRISYKLNLRGPAVVVQSACSTSLLAVHLACRALLGGECDMAIAGGVAVYHRGKGGYMYEEGMILSSDGHCRAFDVSASGMINGEGTAVVVLKLLEHAVRDGDNIYAIIKGTAVNNDGYMKIGYSAPGVEGQAQVIQAAQSMAEIKPETVTYVETHGTGTDLGDPIEIEALKKAFNTGRRDYCGLGSVKTNVGHLGAAAGVTGLIKTVLALKHKQIPPSLHFESPNPKLDLEGSPFYVNTVLKEWKNSGMPLKAGVSSFGIGGTNAHVVLEEWDEKMYPGSGQGAKEKGREYKLILLSAKTAGALKTMTGNLLDFLEENIHSSVNTAKQDQNPGRGINLADAAFTLQVGRSSFKHRKMFVCRNMADVKGIFARPEAGKIRSATAAEKRKTVVFMFSGQGSQYVNMGLGLYRAEPLFREKMDLCFDILNPLASYDLKEILYPHSPGVASDRIDQTEITQPLLFILEYSLAQLLIEWGVKPGWMIGHSIGEYVAACLAGVFPLAEAIELVLWRGRLMQRMPSGAMLSVPLPEEELKPILNKEIDLAAVNSASSCVVSGSYEAIDRFSKLVEEKGCQGRILHTSHAFHSYLMNPVLEEFRKKFGEIKLRKPGIPFISNLTGRGITDEEAVDPGYWVKQLRSTVRFAAGAGQLLQDENSLFIEIGPGRVLSSFVKNHPDRKAEQKVINLVRHPRDNEADQSFLLENIGQLWLYGIEVDFDKFNLHEKRHRISLPLYPFDKQRFWLEGDLFKTGIERFSGNDLSRKKPGRGDRFYIPLWEQSVIAPHETTEAAVKSKWLVFTDDRGFNVRLVDSLKKGDREIITVKTGPDFKLEKDNSYVINPRQSDHYDAFFRQLSENGKIPGKIIHLWGITGKADIINLDNIDHSLEMGFFSLLNIVKTLGNLSSANKIRLHVITDNMQKVTGEKFLCPEKSTLLAAVKVIPLEYANLKCSSIDIELPAAGSREEVRLINDLSAEIAADVDEIVVAYRGDSRWTQMFKPVHLPEPEDISLRLREKGVYLLLGGFGGMGLTIAEDFARNLKAKLILIGRSPFPKRDKWDEWLASNPDEDSTSIKIRKIIELEEEYGAEIMPVCADAANLEQMQQVVAAAENRFGQINGVIHAAGVIDYGGIIHKRTRAVTEKYMAAKVRGTLVLDKIFQGKKLDFLALFSSLGNVVYSRKFGQLSYSAGNEFLEAYADYKTKADETFTVAVNWNDWQEVGMSVVAMAEQNRGEDKDPQYFDALPPADGVDAFKRILLSKFQRVSVSTVDLLALLRVMESKIKDRETSLTEEFADKSAAVPLCQRPDLSNAYVAPRNQMEKVIVGIWEKLLGIEKVGIYDNFFELGADSLHIIKVNEQLKKVLHRNIPIDTMFAYPSIDALVKYLSNEQENGSLSEKKLEKAANRMDKTFKTVKMIRNDRPN